jgi:ribosomal protein L16 Arg81 hydroxylase
LRKKLEKAERDLANALTERDTLQDRTTRALNDLTSANSRRIQAEKEAAGLRDELETALRQNDALKTQLEDETLLRSELQNKVDDLMEDLKMEQRNHQNVSRNGIY